MDDLPDESTGESKITLSKPVVIANIRNSLTSLRQDIRSNQKEYLLLNRMLCYAICLGLPAECLEAPYQWPILVLCLAYATHEVHRLPQANNHSLYLAPRTWYLSTAIRLEEQVLYESLGPEPHDPESQDPGSKGPRPKFDLHILRDWIEAPRRLPIDSGSKGTYPEKSNRFVEEASDWSEILRQSLAQLDELLVKTVRFEEVGRSTLMCFKTLVDTATRCAMISLTEKGTTGKFILSPCVL